MANAHIIKDLLKELKVSVYRFETEIGAGGSTISKAIKNNSELSLELIQKITDRYKTINPAWLKTGQGEMFITNGIAHQEPQPTNNDHTPTQEEVYRMKYEALLEKINAEQSAIITGVLNRIDANLNDAAEKQQTFRLMTGAGQQVTLETLAELLGLPNKHELVERARSIGVSLLNDNEAAYSSDSLGNSGR